MIKDPAGEEFSRRELIFVLANKDGEAHFDDFEQRVEPFAKLKTTGPKTGSVGLPTPSSCLCHHI